MSTRTKSCSVSAVRTFSPKYPSCPQQLMKSSLPSLLSIERKTLGSSWYPPPPFRDGGVTWGLVVAIKIYPFCKDGEVGGIASVSDCDWARRGRGVEEQEVGAFREGKHPLGVWVSVCVCLNLSVCICSGTTPAEEQGCFLGWRVPCLPISSPTRCSLPGATPMGSSPGWAWEHQEH